MPIYHNAFSPALPQVQIPVYGKQRLVSRPLFINGKKHLGQYDWADGGGGDVPYDPTPPDMIFQGGNSGNTGIDLLPQTPDMPGSGLFSDPGATGFDISQLTDLPSDPVTEGIIEGTVPLPSDSGISDQQLVDFIYAGGDAGMLANVLSTNDPLATMQELTAAMNTPSGQAAVAAGKAAKATAGSPGSASLPPMPSGPKSSVPLSPGCPTGYVLKAGSNPAICLPASASTQVPAPSPTVSTVAPAGALSSWFSGSTIIPGVSNAVIAGGGALLLVMLMGGKRR